MNLLFLGNEINVAEVTEGTCESEMFNSQTELDENNEELEAFDNENSERVNTFARVNDPARFQPRAVQPELAAILDAESMQWQLDNVHRDMVYEKSVEAGKFLGSNALQRLMFYMDTKEVITHSGWSFNENSFIEITTAPFLPLTEQQLVNHRRNLTHYGFSVSSHLHEGKEMHSVMFRIDKRTVVSFTRVMEQGDFLSNEIAEKIAWANAWLEKRTSQG